MQSFPPMPLKQPAREATSRRSLSRRSPFRSPRPPRHQFPSPPLYPWRMSRASTGRRPHARLEWHRRSRMLVQSPLLA